MCEMVRVKTLSSWTPLAADMASKIASSVHVYIGECGQEKSAGCGGEE